jgi:orotate phosphoribosyltransferase
MPQYQDDLFALKDLILRRNSVRFGNFKLASGEITDIYVDAKLTTCAAEAMPLVGRVFLHRMRALNWFPEAVGGLMVGAEPIAFSIARESLQTPDPIDAFIVRKEPKPHGMQRLIEGLDPTEGRRVVIIDDVCTKGGSTALAIRNAMAAGIHVLGAICLVDREMGAAELLLREFGFQLAHIFTLRDFRSSGQPEVRRDHQVMSNP